MKDITDKPVFGRMRLAWLDGVKDISDILIKQLGINRWSKEGEPIWLADKRTQEIERVDRFTTYKPKGYMYILYLSNGQVIIEYEDRK